MALLDLPKFALLALLITAMVSTLGGAEMVIKEVVIKSSSDETCKANGEVCGPTFGDCCEGYICFGAGWPWSPWRGSCIPRGDLPDTVNDNRAEAGDEAQMVIKEEVMMVEEIKRCLPEGASCNINSIWPRCCKYLECLPTAPGPKPRKGICLLPRP